MIAVSADSTDIFFKVAERGLYLPMKAGTFQPSGHKALIRQHGEGVKVLNVVKNSYKLVTHREVYDALTPILSEHDVTVSTYHDNDGAKAYIDVQFGQARHLPRWEQCRLPCHLHQWLWWHVSWVYRGSNQPLLHQWHDPW
jgi:hypothetical protein